MAASSQMPRLRSTRAFVFLNPFLQITFLLVLSILMFVLQWKENPFILKARSLSADSIHKLMAVSSRPFLFLVHFQEEWRTLLRSKEENKILYQQLKEFQDVHYTARVLMAENKKLREALKALPPNQSLFLTAKIYKMIHPHRGSQLILEAGREQGLIKGQPVISKGHLIGRLIEVNTKTSRILPLTDPLSRIPVVLELSNLKAILAGHHGGQLVVAHREGNTVIIPGEIAFSSGEGGLFPAGFPLGVLEKSPQGEWHVRPLMSFKDLVFGHVLNSSPLAALLTERNQEESKAPPGSHP